MSDADANKIVLLFWASFAGAGVGSALSVLLIGFLDRWLHK